MTMLTETVDAVIGIGTHRDTHEVEIADAAGKPIAVMRIGNDSAGFARLLDVIAAVAPGGRVAVCMEGSRSFGIGLARALAAAGLLVLECGALSALLDASTRSSSLRVTRRSVSRSAPSRYLALSAYSGLWVPAS